MSPDTLVIQKHEFMSQYYELNVFM